MARLYANENFPLQVVRELRGLGHDVLTTQNAGRVGQAISDEDVLAFAIQERRAVITLNRRHFVRLHDASEGRLDRPSPVAGQSRRKVIMPRDPDSPPPPTPRAGHAGIIVCSLDPEFPAMARRIHQAIQEDPRAIGSPDPHQPSLSLNRSS